MPRHSANVSDALGFVDLLTDLQLFGQEVPQRLAQWLVQRRARISQVNVMFKNGYKKKFGGTVTKIVPQGGEIATLSKPAFEKASASD